MKALAIGIALLAFGCTAADNAAFVRTMNDMNAGMRAAQQQRQAPPPRRPTDCTTTCQNVFGTLRCQETCY